MKFVCKKCGCLVDGEKVVIEIPDAMTVIVNVYCEQCFNSIKRWRDKLK